MKSVFIWFVFLLSLSLYSVKVIGGISVADISLIAFIAISFIIKRRIVLNALNLSYLTWFVISVLCFFLIVKEPYFDVEKYFFSTFRCLTGVLSLLFMPLWLNTIHEKYKVSMALKWFLIFNFFMQVVLMVSFFFNVGNFINIVPFGDQSNRQDWFNVYSYGLYYRFGGLFEEPSWYAWFNIFCLSLCFSISRKYNLHVVDKKVIFLTFLGIVFTFSVAGIFSFFIIAFFMVEKVKVKLLFSSMLSFIFLLVLIFFSENYFIERILSILSGGDGSANARLLGSLLKGFGILQLLPFGSGFGNSINAIDFYIDKSLFVSGTANQNGFVEAFISTGYVGGALYLFPIVSLFLNKSSRLLFFAIALVFFTTSSIFIAPFWVLLGLSFYSLSIKNRNNS
ncbi:MAG: hypothetical protein VX447_18035 [Pseudomonadota bacterium]|nr:hypothetical protein [Pseudomonadota bacterium]